MKKFYRCHYLTVLFSLKKYFWVLLIPVVRTVLAVGFDYRNAFKGYEADIFLLSVLLLYAFTRWLFTSVQINAENITIRKGILFQKTVKVCDENISCIKLWRNPFSVIFSCFILRVYENPTKKPVISIYLSKKAVDEIRKKYFSEEDKLCRYKTKPIFHALVFGGNKGGFLLISAIFSFSGIATGKTLRKLAEENIIAISDLVQDIPSFLVIVGVSLLILRSVSLLLEATAVSDMQIYEHNNTILIKRGIFRKILYRISTKKENMGYILLTNSILLNKYYSLYAGITGFGQGRYDISLILPIIKLNVSSTPEYENHIRSPHKAVSAYIAKWVAVFVCSAVGCPLAAVADIPRLYFYLLLILTLLSSFLIFLNMNKWRRSFIAYNKKNIAFCHISGVKKHIYITERKKCCKIQIQQSIFQKRKNIADIRFYLKGYSNKKMRIRHLPMEKCMEIAENC